MTDNAQNSNGLLNIIEWLSGDECNTIDDIGLVAHLGRKLHRLGIPVDRLTLHITTLHPDLMGRTIAWAPGEPIEIHERDRTGWTHFAGSPITQVMKSHNVLVVSANDDDSEHWQRIDVFAGRSLNQLIVAPMCNADGPVSVVAFGTRKADGFTLREQQMFLRILPALRTASELRVLRQAELSLLDTYIGPMTAQRILAGRIRQGEVETIEAALLLCDLREFAELSNKLDATSVLDILNGYFEKVIPVITGNGGEVLRFMGDAILAFFPGHSAASSCDAALQSASAIIEDMARSRLHGVKVSVGIALHYGEVSYGNIGTGRRMGFTVVGPDVNMVSCIQSVRSELRLPLLMSERFENAVAADTKSAGHYSLKGFPTTAELFTSNSTYSDDSVAQTAFADYVSVAR